MKNNVFTLVRLMSVTLFSMFALASLAQSAKIGVQGILRKGDGKSVEDGNYAITFRLYDVSTGGTALWSEVQSQVEVAGGIYSVQLGSVNSLSLPFDSDYYLSVQVGDSPEITPRQQLTVAPYALSFKGTGNVFPSSGAIGIGTTSPASGSNLHLKNASGVANQLTEGTTGSRVELKKGAATATIGHSSSGTFMEINAGANTALQYNGADKLLVTSSGISLTGTGTFTGGVTVSAGTVTAGNFTVSGSDINNQSDTDIKRAGTTMLGIRSNGAIIPGHLNVTGSKNYTGTFAFYNGSNNQGCQTDANFSSAYSISCSDRVRAPEFNAFSDRRIKKDITSSNAVADLEILRGLCVSDYRYKDSLMYGLASKKGFIAQEVKEAFPESVTTTTGVIPDIYQKSARISREGDNLSVSLPGVHRLSSGDTVRIMFDGNYRDCRVAGTPDAHTFTVSGWRDPAPDELFVFGRQVNDFLQVDYDRIHTLNVSVTQELLRRKDALEREKASLKRDNEALKASLDNIDVRMRKVEATLSH